MSSDTAQCRKKVDRGIETAEVHLSRTLFQRALRAGREGNEWEMKRILAGQYLRRPRFDPMDIIEVEWEKADQRIRDAVTHDLVVTATIRVARGGRRLSEFILQHSLSCDSPDSAFTSIVQLTDGDGEGGGDRIWCSCHCGDSMELSRQSLRQHSWEEEDVRR